MANILSVFDGMACGYLAMLAAGIKVDKYVCYEIDKYATQTSKHNFPDIEQNGDVFEADFTKYKGYDYLIGGSPCTYWSIAQTKNRETVASGMGWELFSQYVRALKEAEPKYFLYENNKSMSQAIRQSITETFGFEPICINSALVSAQNRQRLYWVGERQPDGTYKKVDIEQPDDRGIMLKDILETYYPAGQYVKNADKGAQVLNINPSNHGMNGAVIHCEWKSRNLTTNKGEGPKIIEPVCVAQRGRNPDNPSDRTPGAPTEQRFEAHTDGKTNTLTTVSKDNLIAEPICLNSKSGRGGVDGLQPSLQDRIYSIDGKHTAVTTAFMPNIAEPIKPMMYELESVNDSGTMAMLDMKGQEQIRRVYVTDGKAPTVTTCQGGHRDPKIFSTISECFKVKEATKQGYTEILSGECVDMSMPNSKTRRGRNMDKKSNCLQTSCSFYQYCGTVKTPIYKVENGMITVKGKQYPIKLVDGYYIIRKLTVKECMRLQTVPEWYEFPVSNSQAYKMLGNGWTVEVIAHLLRATKQKQGGNNDMELKVNQITIPEVIEFNYEELKSEITQKVEVYKSLVYGENEIKEAKKDRANLNKFVKVLSDERIRIKKQCLQPYEEFERKVKELSQIVQEPIDLIDSQVKAYEDKQKKDKYADIENIFNDIDLPDNAKWVSLALIFDDKWLNTTTSMSQVKDSIFERLKKITDDLEIIENLTEYAFEATEVYKTTLDINKAVNEAKKWVEIAKAKEAAEAQKRDIEAEAQQKAQEELARLDQEAENLRAAAQSVAESSQDEPRQWIKFEAHLTVSQAKALAQYFSDNHITFRPVK